MIGEEKRGACVASFCWCYLAFGFFIATYNLLILVMHKANRSDAGELHDPIVSRPDELRGGGGAKFHGCAEQLQTHLIANGNADYVLWYKKMRRCAWIGYGGFTRILHSGNPDNLMEEIPSIVVDPLPEGLDRGYIVLNMTVGVRAVAGRKAPQFEEEYILMAEPDHIFVNPLPNLAHGDHPAAFPFFYIKPAENEKISILEKIAPTWMNVSLRMKDDRRPIRPLAGSRMYVALIGEWRFDKKSHHLRGPPKKSIIQKGLPVLQRVPEKCGELLVKAVNEASANIPNWDTQ
ncbi:Hydroxyproline O-arabinosyltransferase RDN2 [Sesamum alatum]|uniref:Hydroxyproline O-arabinosyltransferase RDN2 n=1 Tax=Sesamum alatum TaxID=300844 RepID=A0AAE1XXY6_9LAMI|nr:Hydroxyproline O-arabinosyltransferase RDN2 [Sesamum alatum]